MKLASLIERIFCVVASIGFFVVPAGFIWLNFTLAPPGSHTFLDSLDSQWRLIAVFIFLSGVGAAWKTALALWLHAFALRNLGDVRDVEPLLARLKDQDRDIRSSAAMSLGKLGDVRAFEPLLACLKDHDQFVRNCAIEALGVLGDVRAFEPLLACLENQDEYVRGWAADALGNLGDVRAVEPLLVCLKDKDEFVRNRVAQALSKLGKAQ